MEEKVTRAVAASGLRIWGAFEGQTHIFGGQDIIFKKVLLFSHAVVTGPLSPPRRFAPLSKGGDIPRKTVPGGGIS